MLFPERLDDYIAEDNPVRAVDVFVDDLDLAELGFERAEPAETGRPAYHPATLLKIYIYGYLNRIQSSRRLEREAQRNVELIWLTGRLMPDFKTIADFRRDNGEAIRKVCREFVLCAGAGAVRRCHGGHRRQQVQGGRLRSCEWTVPALAHDPGPVAGFRASGSPASSSARGWDLPHAQDNGKLPDPARPILAKLQGKYEQARSEKQRRCRLRNCQYVLVDRLAAADQHCIGRQHQMKLQRHGVRQ